MINQPNNILSYFIKDIKDATELAFYKQINHNNSIHIIYKYKLIYLFDKYYYNYINNIIKGSTCKYIDNYKICSNYGNNYKKLYYNNDNKITFNNPRCKCIKFYYLYLYNKYLNKNRFYYIINDNHVLILYIKNYNQYKYISITYTYKKSIKYSKNLILIPNKYELSYYCKFFNLYFDNT